ncbi:MAG: permease prefix domain 1-containing protein [Planctomycetota bacterium]|jgi:hypothetical protein
MQSFEEYAQQVTDELDLSDVMKERIKQEIVAHLEDEMQRCLSEGLTQADAHGIALERFGKEQTISRLVAQALAQKQARFRRRCTVSGIVFAVGLILVAIGVGAWMTVFKDAVAGRDFSSSMPRLAWLVMYLGASVGCLAILAMVVAALFRVSRLLAALSIIAVVVIFYVSMYLFHVIPPLRETIGTIRAGQSGETRVINSFLMRLYLCWVPTVMTGAIMAMLARRRAYILWLSACFGTGLVSAVLWGLNSVTRPAPWMYWMKWPKLLATGLLALVFVMLTGLLARSISGRFGWGDCRRADKLTRGSEHIDVQSQSGRLAEV